MSDERMYETFYGIETNDWFTAIPLYGNLHKILVKNYISEDASTTTNSKWQSSGSVFIYPHNIKKIYYLEGVVEGQVTFTSEGSRATSYVSDYRVSIIKISESATETLLATTGVISVNDNIVWNTSTSTGEYVVYPFWIDIFTSPKEVGENERLGIKIEWNINNTSTVTAWLSHENWQQGEDIKIIMPFMLG